MLESRQGLRFWLTSGRRYGLEHWLYLGQRVSGLGMLLYLLLHILVTASRLGGESAWEAAMDALKHPLFTLLEYLVFAAFAFHALNGLRLLVSELGWAVGRPGRPDYPYVSCLLRQRPLAWAVVALAVVVAGLGAVDFFFWR